MRRPKPPRKSMEELRGETRTLLAQEFHDPAGAVDFVLAMMTGFDLEALISQLIVRQQQRKGSPK